MFDRILRAMRRLVRTDSYLMTLHGNEEMEADELTVLDVRQCIFTGDIIDRQRDHRTRESKFLIEGETVSGDRIVVVAKIGVYGKLVVITVYRS
jgi:hypothetical protein